MIGAHDELARLLASRDLDRRLEDIAFQDTQPLSRHRERGEREPAEGHSSCGMGGLVSLGGWSAPAYALPKNVTSPTTEPSHLFALVPVCLSRRVAVQIAVLPEMLRETWRFLSS
jgi:hypothetical protein